MHEKSSLKSQALQGLIGRSGEIHVDIVARWPDGEAQVGNVHLSPREFLRVLGLAGRHDDHGYRMASHAIVDEVLSRIGLLCTTGLPANHELYLRPKPTRVRLQGPHGRHLGLFEVWLAVHRGGVCLHFGSTSEHFPMEGPGAAGLLRSLHDVAAGRAPSAALWGNSTIERGQATVLCHFLDGFGMRVPVSAQ